MATMTFSQIAEILRNAGWADAATAAERLHAVTKKQFPVPLGYGFQFPAPSHMNDEIYACLKKDKAAYASAMADARIVKMALCDIRDGVAPDA